MTQNYIAIDPGVGGGIAFIDTDGYSTAFCGAKASTACARASPCAATSAGS